MCFSQLFKYEVLNIYFHTNFCKRSVSNSFPAFWSMTSMYVCTCQKIQIVKKTKTDDCSWRKRARASTFEENGLMTMCALKFLGFNGACPYGSFIIHRLAMLWFTVAARLSCVMSDLEFHSVLPEIHWLFTRCLRSSKYGDYFGKKIID